MLIPSIDLRGGRVVQLIQGERLAFTSDDVFVWIRKFKNFQKIQLIDLDGALGSGTNDNLVRLISARLPCRVGGGIRSIERAQQIIGYGATAVILGSSLFKNGSLDRKFASKMASAIGPEHIIAAVDTKAGYVTTKGWREQTHLTATEAIAELDPYCSEFLYTHVDTEGLMNGIDMDAIKAVRQATTQRISAAGGITSQEEIDQLDAIGIDAVVGMAIYTGRLNLSM